MPPHRPKKPQIFLTNKSLLAEIHRCKATFCSFTEDRYADFDAIVTDLAEVTDEFLAAVCARKSKELTPKRGETVEVTPEGLVIRLMTYDHVPLDPDRPRKSRRINQTHALVPFPPFKHFVIEVDAAGQRTLREVGRSHWEGGIHNGWFNPQKGRVTERMGAMYDLLVNRYARKPNWNAYTYLEEMKGAALLQLCATGLTFDESKSSNPFAYYTTTMTHCFTRVFNNEKKVQDHRDDMLIQAGVAPSHTRQTKDALANMGLFEPPRLQGKRGRPSKKGT